MTVGRALHHTPESHIDLLHRPLFAHLATVRPDGSIDPDPDAVFYLQLQQRYDETFPIGDAPVRVVISVRTTSFVAVTRGIVVPP